MNADPHELTHPITPAPAVAALPRSILFVALILIAFIGLLTLETSDSLVRHNGQIARSLFVLPVVILLLRGVLTRRRWAWRTTRILALLAAALYAVPSIGVWFFFLKIQIGQRLWLSGVGATLISLAISAYLALGRRPARAYFRI
ncbi:MAG: hypothetical protein ABJF10_13230 [Chthoniobacter sp.]|uniref:hypothetical protein n=1 Tax=Chthoniobacter sp. TaxID=2510640 RepID=UPI0032A5B7AE